MIKANLTQSLIDEFNQNGFLIFNEFIEPNSVNILRDKIEPLFRGYFETGIEPDEWNWKFGRDSNELTRQICNAWKSDNYIKKLVCNQIIGEFCSQLMNWSGAKLVQDNVLWKPPGGKSLLYHQDAAYDDWLIPQTMITCWMTLDGTSKEKGTLEYVKGSHKWNIMPPKGDFHSPEDYKQELHNYAKQNHKNIEIVYVEVPAGGATFHHGNTWHGSGVNNSLQDRRAIVSHCVPYNAKFHPTNTGGTGRIYRKYKKNDSDELDISFFPLLWKKNKFKQKNNER